MALQFWLQRHFFCQFSFLFLRNPLIEKYIILSNNPIKTVTPQVRGWAVGLMNLSKTSVKIPNG